MSPLSRHLSLCLVVDMIVYNHGVDITTECWYTYVTYRNRKLQVTNNSVIVSESVLRARETIDFSYRISTRLVCRILVPKRTARPCKTYRLPLVSFYYKFPRHKGADSMSVLAS